MSNLYLAYLKLPKEIYLNGEPSVSAPSESQKIDKIDVSEDGIFVTFQGVPYLHKGYPHPLHVRATETVKKLMLSAIRIMAAAPYLIPFLYLARKKILLEFSRFSGRVLRDYYFKREYYITSGQEIYRVGMIGYNPLNFELVYNLTMLLVMLWEYDDAYRYRGQFIISQLDQKALREHPRKELKRLCDILIERETEETMKHKWRSLKKVISVLPLKLVAGFLLELDLEKLKMDESDKYFANQKRDFNYA